MSAPVPPGDLLRPTTARWVNRRRRVRGSRGVWTEKWAKVLAHEGTYEQFRYGTHTETTWTGGPFQKAVICSPWSGVIAVDVDDEADFKTTRTGQLIGREHAISTRGWGFHILIDARAVPPGQWPPSQRAVAGADIKSCGFIPMPGSRHYSDELYEPVPGARVLPAWPELMAAILADQADYQASGNGSGSEQSGHGGGHDGEVSAKTKGMIMRRLRAGWQPGQELKEDVYREWLTVAIGRDPADPFTRDDFDRHYGDERRGGLEDALKDFRAEQKVLASGGAEWAQGTIDLAPAPAAVTAPADRQVTAVIYQPRIDCGYGHGPEVIRAVQGALNKKEIPGTYVTGGRVVILEEVSGSPDMVTAEGNRPLPVEVSQAGAAALQSLLAQHTFTYMWVPAGKDKKADQKEFTPSAAHLAAALAPKSWPGLAPLNGIIGSPVLRPDGTLLTEPGYDKGSGLYLASRVQIPPVPAQPEAHWVAWARDLLFRCVLGQFPWVSPADKANYIAMLVTQMLRRYLRGSPAPFFPVTATAAGSGKTLLVTIPGALYGLVKLTWTDDEEELRKQLTTAMTDQSGVIAFDNVPKGTVIRSAVLSKLLTDRTWGDRLLGGNALAKFANDRLWTATGNNLRIGGDNATRSVLISLDPRTEHPERRTDFVLGDLESWIEDPWNQQALLGAMLILVADWAAAGCPGPVASLAAMRQFTAWARACGGFLDHHGISGFLGNAGELEDMDDDAADSAQFLARWHSIHGATWVTAAQLHALRDDGRWEGTFPTGRGGDDLSVKSLGKRLAGDRGYHGGYVLKSQSGHESKRWWWVEIQQGG